jgi:outer membrane protein OmpA-like peptidoglycan-associated protein
VPTLDPNDILYVFNNKVDSTLARVEREPVSIPVLLNDVPVRLPAIHARGVSRATLLSSIFSMIPQIRSLVYDIYFAFNSATLRAESDPSLREIATALQRHPDWKLDVSGHTDNIGGRKPTSPCRSSVRRP